MKSKIGYEVVVIWQTGEKEVISYSSEELADETARQYKMVFGNQISWIGVRETR